MLGNAVQHGAASGACRFDEHAVVAQEVQPARGQVQGQGAFAHAREAAQGQSGAAPVQRQGHAAAWPSSQPWATRRSM
jgi:hypothetical protein